MQFVEYISYKELQNRRIRRRERSMRCSDTIADHDKNLRKVYEHAERQRAFKAAGGVPKPNGWCPFGRL